MALKDIRRESVIKAIKKFDKIGQDRMLAEYDGKRSTRWYILYKGKRYVKKLICRAAHCLQGLGDLGDFKARDARHKLAKLGFDVVKCNKKLPVTVINELRSFK